MQRPGRQRTSGFTLVEALLSVAILALMASVMAGLYMSGLQTIDASNERIMLDSFLRSKMEELISTNFDQLAVGSDTITVGGRDYARAWTVNNVDLDGDTNPEPTAKLIEVKIGDLSLATIVVDNEGRVGKI